MDKLRYYQKEAIEQIIEFYNSGIKNAKIIISTGLGSTKILVSSIERILSENRNCKILLLCSYRSSVKQYIVELMSCSSNINVVDYLPDIRNNGIFIVDYRDILTQDDCFDFNQFDFIICNDLDMLNDNNVYPFFSNEYKGKRLTLLTSEENNKLVKNDKLLFQYNISDATKDGYFAPMQEMAFLQDFFLFLLNYLGFQNIELEKEHHHFRADIEADNNGKHYVFEIKTYRTKYASSNLIESAAYKFLGATKHIEAKNFNSVMIVSCKLDEDLKEKIYEDTNIELWDISNLLYLCEDSQILMQKLSLYIPFPLSDIKAKNTILFNKKQTIIDNQKVESKYQEFEARLDKCKPGKEHDKEYEEICTDIIKYLFETEFFQMSNQYQTKDNLFRMDMICSLKGTTEFWKFLMQFFNTKFVVFEYKNYTETISQNLVFITSKYLYPSALRNVAFLISRNGLDVNANTVVSSKIKNEKTLIISLTDEDLLIMVALKDAGNEPSDYLLEKVENLLMSLSI